MSEIEELTKRIERLERLISSLPQPNQLELPSGEYTQTELLIQFPYLTSKTLGKHLPPHTKERRRTLGLGKTSIGDNRKEWVYYIIPKTSVPTEAPD
jgi:hypothetical protein